MCAFVQIGGLQFVLSSALGHCLEPSIKDGRWRIVGVFLAAAYQPSAPCVVAAARNRSWESKTKIFRAPRLLRLECNTRPKWRMDEAEMPQNRLRRSESTGNVHRQETNNNGDGNVRSAGV